MSSLWDYKNCMEQTNTNPLAFSTAEVFTWTNLTSDRIVFHTSVSDSRFTISYNTKMSFDCHVLSATSAATWWAPPFLLTTHHSPEVLCWHGDVIINIAGNFLGVRAKRGSNIMPRGQEKQDPPNTVSQIRIESKLIKVLNWLRPGSVIKQKVTHLYRLHCFLWRRTLPTIKSCQEQAQRKPIQMLAMPGWKTSSDCDKQRRCSLRFPIMNKLGLEGTL